MTESQRRQAFLYLLTAGQAFGFVTWSALLKNFAIEVIGVDGFENSVLEAVREIPGFLAFTTVLLLAYMREQRLALISTLVLGVGVGAAEQRQDDQQAADAPCSRHRHPSRAPDRSPGPAAC